MSVPTMAEVLLSLGFVVLGLLLYRWHRSKQYCPAAMKQEPKTKDDSDEEDLAYYDSFYCIMLSDGTCRSGYMIDRSQRAPDVCMPDGHAPSDK